MSEIVLPRWDAKFNIIDTGNFNELAQLVVTYFNFYDRIHKVIAPYEARQRQIEKIDEDSDYVYKDYTPPTLEFLEANIRRGPIPEKVYKIALQSMVDFCTSNKGQFALHDPHPATIHSVQVPKGAFLINNIDGGKQEVHVMGLKQPIIVAGLRDAKTIQHLIIRPSPGTSGLPNLSRWNLLIFYDNFGYIPLWADSMVNPKFAGAL